MRLTLTCLLVLAAAPALADPYPRPPSAERIDGVVMRVVDGDGLVVRRADGREVEIRLQGIDAPEITQSCETTAHAPYPCGQRAAERLAALAPPGAAIRCVDPADDPVDLYGRHLGFCSVGPLDLNLTLLEEGHAIVFRRFVVEHPTLGRRPHAEAFLAAEARARSGRRGLWQGLFTPPWDYRAARRR